MSLPKSPPKCCMVNQRMKMKTGVMHMSARGPTLSRPGKRPEDLPLLFSHIAAAWSFLSPPCGRGEEARRRVASWLYLSEKWWWRSRVSLGLLYKHCTFTTQCSPSDQDFFAFASPVFVSDAGGQERGKERKSKFQALIIML